MWLLPVGLFLVFGGLVALSALEDGAELAHLQRTDSQTSGWRIYDPNPEHIWNRLYRSLYSRIDRDGREYGSDELDPLLWPATTHLLRGPSYHQVIKTLDEFLNTNAEKLISDPLKRAMLQRDLWSVFDWLTQKSKADPEIELQVKLAAVIRRVALSADQLKSLPRNYDAAIASKSFAPEADPKDPSKVFLPSDLFLPGSQWVAVRVDDDGPIARSHVFFFSGRSVFEVFIRLPEGREATLAYLKRLAEFPKPWIRQRRSLADVSPNPLMPQFPAGTKLALVRRMMAIDESGGLVPTNIIEGLQIRIHREIPLEIPDSFNTDSTEAQKAMDVYEFKLSRVKLFARDSGGLRAVARDETEFPLFQSHGIDLFDFQRERGAPIDRHLRHPLASCSNCHFRPGIHSVLSRMPNIVELRIRDVRRELVASSDSAEVANSVVKWKLDQDSWKRLLQLWPKAQ